jgi:hypothetical protein
MRVQDNQGNLWYVYWRYNHKLKPKINKHLQVIFDHIPISTECYIRNSNKEIISTGISRVYKVDRNRYTKAEGRQRSFNKSVHNLIQLNVISSGIDFYNTFDVEIKNKVILDNLKSIKLTNKIK